MAILVVEHSFDPPLTEASLKAAFEKLDPCFKAHGAKWIRSYVSDDGGSMICEFEAGDTESVRASLRAAETPFKRIWSAQLYK